MELEETARALRKDPTPAEAALWERLRGSQLGIPFRRQYPWMRFILDFCSPNARIIVEVDGGIHELQRERDAERDEFLRSAGYQVLHFTNEQVLGDADAVVAAIEAAIRSGVPR